MKLATAVDLIKHFCVNLLTLPKSLVFSQQYNKHCVCLINGIAYKKV
jgi:hypothetical protein